MTSIVIRNKSELAKAKHKVELLEKAWEKALAAKQYSAGPMTIERQDLDDIEADIQAYQTAIDSFEQRGTSKRRSVRIVPL